MGQSRPGTSVPQEGSSGSNDVATCHIDYDRLATACARGAYKGALGVTGSVRSSTRGEDEAQGALADIEDKATEKGEWSIFDGARAEALLRKLPVADAHEFEARLREMVRTGVLKPQEGAWVPAEQQLEK